MNDPLLQELMDRVRNRFYGKYRGVVTDVDASTMRVKASVQFAECMVARTK